MKQLLLLIAAAALAAQTVPFPGPVFPVSGGGGGGWTPGYVTAGVCYSGGLTCTISLAVTSGNQFVCLVGSNSGSTGTLSCSGTSPNSWSTTSPTNSPYTDSNNASYTVRVGLFWGAATATTTETFTCGDTNSANYFTCAVMIFSGTPSSGWDVSLAGANNITTNSWVSGTSGTTSTAHELAVGGFMSDASGGNQDDAFTGTGGWTCPAAAGPSAGPSMGGCYKVLTSTGTQQITATKAGSTESGAGVVSTIK